MRFKNERETIFLKLNWLFFTSSESIQDIARAYPLEHPNILGITLKALCTDSLRFSFFHRGFFKDWRRKRERQRNLLLMNEGVCWNTGDNKIQANFAQ